MKKIVIALALAALLAGCQKPEVEGPVESKDVFTASVEEFDAQTKTSMTENRRIVWSAGDRLSIFQGSTVADEYVLADGSAGLSSGSFKWVSKDNEANSDFGAGFELPCNVAFYPYAEGLLLDGDMLEDGKQIYTISTVVLPEVQTYVANSFGNGAFPMVAVTRNMADHNLKFKNIGGALKLQLKGSCVVKSIKVEGKNGEKLSGAATVTAYANNQDPAIKMASDASTFVMLDCGDGVQLSEREVTNFYIALPPVVFEKGFAITVTDTEKKECTVSAIEANTILRSTILVMPEVIVEPEVVENPEDDLVHIGDYVDEYGINHGQGVEIDGVVWAPVNCGYHVTDYKWGKLYQWGRKYGQGYDGDATTPEIAEGAVSIAVANQQSNENVFYKFFSDELAPYTDMLWNRGTSDYPLKTEYDPCPDGWRVPTYAELSKLYRNHSSFSTNSLGQNGYWFSGSSSFSEDVPQVFFPAAGWYYWYSGASERDNFGFYWSSSSNRYIDEVCTLSLYFSDGGVAMNEYGRKEGHSVRCVLDLNDDNSVTLTSNSLTLYEGDEAQLFTILGPGDAGKTVAWSSSNASVATVDQSGLITAVSAGETIISATTGGVAGHCSVKVSAPAIAVYDYVDEYGIYHGKGTAIGMAVWAPVNCGYHATDYKWGKLYQWGRKYGQGYEDDATTPTFAEAGVSAAVGNLESNANVFYKGSGKWLYTHNDKLWNSGTEESPVKTEYDPCPQGWRVPTSAELSQLHQNFSSSTTNSEGLSGLWFSGSSVYSEDAARVFFPAAAYRSSYESAYNETRGSSGHYWSSKSVNDYSVSFLAFISEGAEIRESNPSCGCSVRCVQYLDEEVVPVSRVEISPASIELYDGSDALLTVTIEPHNATHMGIVWSSSDPSIAYVEDGLLLVAKSPGTVTISAISGDVVGTCLVTVLPAGIPTVDYIDEYGINHGKGKSVGLQVWAPVNCGYHATDYKYGKTYQWGRKYGQGVSGDATTPKYVQGPVSEVEGNLESNSNVRYTGCDDWASPSNDKLWSSTMKTEYDPCPDGWRVPSDSELGYLLQNHGLWQTNSLGQQGYWFRGESALDPAVFIPGGDYWTTRAIFSGSLYIGVGNDYEAPTSNELISRSANCYVRCVQE